ncbi:MAG: hypothetical protein ABH807_00580 [Candidatus Shapirobacteria bacterium]
MFFIFLVLAFGGIVLVLSLERAAEQIIFLDFNYSINVVRDRFSIFFTFDKKARAELFLALSVERQKSALELADKRDLKGVLNLAQKARGYLSLAVLSGQFDRDLLSQKAEQYNFFINKLQEKTGEKGYFNELRIKDPLAF